MLLFGDKTFQTTAKNSQPQLHQATGNQSTDIWKKYD